MATIDYITPALQQYEQAKAENTASTEQLKRSYDQIYASQAAQYQKQADSDIAKIETEYKGLYDRAALQQLVNERELERRQANLGLTDSGLTATQQTAIQVARGNADAKIDLQKQAAIDSITLQLEQYLAQVDQNRAQAYAQADYNLNTTNTTLYNQLLSQAYSNQATYDAAQIQAAATERAAQIQAQAAANNNSAETASAAKSAAVKSAADTLKNMYSGKASTDSIYSYVYGLDSTYNLSDSEILDLLSYAGVYNLNGYATWARNRATRDAEEKAALSATMQSTLKSYSGKTYDEIFGIWASYANGTNNWSSDSRYAQVMSYLDEWLATHSQKDKFIY